MIDQADIDRIAAAVAAKLGPARDALLDRQQLAAKLGVGERTVSAMVQRAELPKPLLHTGGVARWDWGQVLKLSWATP